MTRTPSRAIQRGGGWLLLAAAVLLAVGLPDDASAQSRDPAGDFFIPGVIGHTPIDIWSDGHTMWGPDMVNDKIYAYDMDTKARDQSKEFDTLRAAGNTGPVGVWSDGNTMWVADVVDVKLYAYDMTTMQRDSSKDFETLAGAGNDYPRGIWSDGNTMWVADEEDDRVYAYDMATKARDQSKEFGTLDAAGNNDPRGLWSDGDTVWVVDNDDGKVYAYNMTTKQPDATRDFDELAAAGITYPYGIWSDGETVWISDTVKNAIYAYTDLAADPAVPSSNGAPAADAGADLATSSGDTVTLNGTASSDPDGDAVTYSWIQVHGPAVTLSNSTAPSPTFTAPDYDPDEAVMAYPDMNRKDIDWFSLPWTDLTFLLSVSDGHMSGIDTVVVSVAPAAGILVGDAGANQTVSVNQTVTLDGTVSRSIDTNTGLVLGNDGSNGTVTYTWSQASGDAVTLSDAASPSPTFTAPASPSILVFRLNVTDGTLHSVDTVTITVRAPAVGNTVNAAVVTLTHVDGGSGFVPYVDGMTVHTDTPRFRGASDGYDSVRLVVRDSDGTVTQIGSGTGVKDDGSFQRGRTALSDGTYAILVGTANLGTITIEAPQSAPQADAPVPEQPAQTVSITRVHDGTQFVTYVDGMTVRTDTPRFQGVSTGYDSIALNVRDSDGTTTQIGSGTGVNGDGSFQRGRTTLSDGTYAILVGEVRLGTITVDTNGGQAAQPTTTVETGEQAARSASITHIHDGSGFVPYVDGMTVHTDTPKFRGASDGYDSVRLMVRDSDGTVTQIGSGTDINDDGSFQRGRTTLSDGTYSIFVNSEPGTILGTFVVRTGG